MDRYENPVNDFNFNELKEIGIKTKAVYGNDINYNKISIIKNLLNLDQSDETFICLLLANKEKRDDLKNFK